MAKRFKGSGKRQRTYLAQWRQARGLTQIELAERVSEQSGDTITNSMISRIESARSPYNQDFIEAAAAVLGCAPCELIGRDPRQDDDIGDVWQELRRQERRQAIEIIRAIINTRSDG